MKTKNLNKRLLYSVLAGLIVVIAGIPAYYFYNKNTDIEPENGNVVENKQPMDILYPKFKWERMPEAHGPVDIRDLNNNYYHLRNAFYNIYFNEKKESVETGIAYQYEIERKSDLTVFDPNDPVYKEAEKELNDFREYYIKYAAENGFEKTQIDNEMHPILAKYGIKSIYKFLEREKNDISGEWIMSRLVYFKVEEESIRYLRVNLFINDIRHYESDKAYIQNYYSVYLSEPVSLEKIAKDAGIKY